MYFFLRLFFSSYVAVSLAHNGINFRHCRANTHVIKCNFISGKVRPQVDEGGGEGKDEVFREQPRVMFFFSSSCCCENRVASLSASYFQVEACTEIRNRKRDSFFFSMNKYKLQYIQCTQQRKVEIEMKSQ